MTVKANCQVLVNSCTSLTYAPALKPNQSFLIPSNLFTTYFGKAQHLERLRPALRRWSSGVLVNSDHKFTSPTDGLRTISLPSSPCDILFVRSFWKAAYLKRSLINGTTPTSTKMSANMVSLPLGYGCTSSTCSPVPKLILFDAWFKLRY